MVRVVVGTQFGDEGKGRAIEFLTPKVDVIARYQGGANAGHTIYKDKEAFIFHLVPSGAIYPHTLCVMGNGTVIDPSELTKEIETLKSKGINLDDRLFISEQAHVVMPYHKLRDDTNGYLGTTRKGIGPCYEDKYARRGIRIGDLLYPEVLKDKLKSNLTIFQSFNFELHSIYEQYKSFGSLLQPFVTDTSLLLNHWIDEGKEVLLEGAQGLLLDIDHGTYPFVTSSHSHSGGACCGLGISPVRIDEVIGVTKAYITRVGNGPLPTRLPPDLEEKVRKRGGEYGATTGRPRRCGWLDIALLRKALTVNNIKKIILTKLDVLDELSQIKICKEYKAQKQPGPLSCHSERSQESHFLFSVSELISGLQPVYEKLPGWKTSTRHIRKYQNLPETARKYIERISELLQVKIIAICVGPKKEATIEL